jgi:hypothetical protein
VAVRTLNNFLPYVPKIWHRPCFEEHKRQTATPSIMARAPVPAG